MNRTFDGLHDVAKHHLAQGLLEAIAALNPLAGGEQATSIKALKHLAQDFGGNVVALGNFTGGCQLFGLEGAVNAEGEPLLSPIFWALHEATFKGVPGYSFEAPQESGDEDTGCTFLFGSK